MSTEAHTYLLKIHFIVRHLFPFHSRVSQLYSRPHVCMKECALRSECVVNTSDIPESDIIEEFLPFLSSFLVGFNSVSLSLNYCRPSIGGVKARDSNFNAIFLVSSVCAICKRG